MMGPPERNEAAPYYFKYIDRVKDDDIAGVLEAQIEETTAFLGTISEQQSLHSYVAEKWTIRQMWNHVNDAERVFLFRAFWFARGFDSPLPSFDQDICAGAAQANHACWASHIEEFRRVRLATVSFYRSLPAAAWTRSGIASDNHFTVLALAYILAGHVLHHKAIIEERYL
jgi:DinB superfamily